MPGGNAFQCPTMKRNFRQDGAQLEMQADDIVRINPYGGKLTARHSMSSPKLTEVLPIL
jgi:hypothetical protein